MDFKIQFVGDSCISFLFGNRIDRELNQKIVEVYQKIKKEKLWKSLPVVDVIPTYCSLAFHLKSGEFVRSEAEKLLSQTVKTLFDQQGDSQNRQQGFKDVIIPVNYNGVDLERVASVHSMSPAEVVRLHSAPAYRVAMVGFRPYFPYLIGLDARLETPRLETPRVEIPAGAVAIGGAQTGVYPEPSPGGWNIIGSADPALLKKVNPGDRIIFKPKGESVDC